MATWLPVPGWPMYEASDMGDVRRVGGKILRGSASARKGKPTYRCVILYNRDQRRAAGVNVLIAETFLGPRPSKKHQAAHLNGNSLDNRLENIEWVPATVNAGEHKRLHGTLANGEKQGSSKLTEQQVKDIRAHSFKWGDQGRLAKKYGVSPSTISLILLNKTWNHV